MRTLLALLLTVNLAHAADPLLGEVNAVRVRYGKPALTEHQTLKRIAADHADWMARTRTLSHRGQGGTWPWERATAAGYRWADLSEVAAAGHRSEREAVLGWLSSKVGHREAVLGQWREAGAGSATARNGERYWCVVLATPTKGGGKGLRAPEKPPPCSSLCSCSCNSGGECRCKDLVPEWPATPPRRKADPPDVIRYFAPTFRTVAGGC